MKKIIAKLSLLILLVCMFQFSCKKSDNANSPDSASKGILKNALINYINAQEELATNKSFVDSLNKMAVWDDISAKAINNYESFAFVPVQLNNNITGLVFVIDNKSLTVEQGYLLEMSGKLLNAATAPEVVAVDLPLLRTIYVILKKQAISKLRLLMAKLLLNFRVLPPAQLMQSPVIKILHGQYLQD